MSKSKIDITKKISIYFLLLVLLVMIMFPLIYIILASFKSNVEILSDPGRLFPRTWSFDNYIDAWTSETLHVGRMLFNSVWFTLSTVVITLVTSSVTGYVFERGEFKLKKLIFGVFSALMFISLGSITIYPQFEILSIFKLNKSLAGLLVLTCFGIPVVNMYLVKGFVASIPREIDESAKIDGCTFTGIFFRIILPLLKPILTTIAVLTFNSSWNSYLMPAMFTMTRPEQQTLIVGIMALKNSGTGASQWDLMFAGTVIVIIPVLIMFAIASKYFIAGLTEGAVKG